MTDVLVIDVQVEEDRTEHGVWCGKCLLPSALVLHLRFYILTEDGVSGGEMGTMPICRGCPDT